MRRPNVGSRHVRSLACLLLVVVVAACGGDSGTAPTSLGLDTAGLASLILETGEPGGTGDLGEVTVVAYARDAMGAPVAGIPVVFHTTAGEFLGGSQAITDASGRATAVLRAEDEAMVIATGGGVQSPELYVSAAGTIRFIFRFRGTRADAGETEIFYVQANAIDGGAVRGKLEIEFGDERTKRLSFDRKIEIPHIFRSAGSYRIRVSIEDERGRRGKGSFRLRVGGRVAVAFQVTGDTTAMPTEETAHRIRATRSDGERVTGTAFVDFGDGETTTVEGFDFEELVFHHYALEGEYTVEVQLIADNGKEATATKDIRIREGGSGLDDIDASTIRYLHYSIADWEINSTITTVTVSASTVCIFHTRAGGWPVFEGAEGNPWVFAKIGSGWVGGTFEWLRPGQQCKGVTPDNIGQHVKQVPMIAWVPKAGDEVCWAMSTHARFGPQSSLQARTQIACGVYKFGTVVRTGSSR